MTSEQFRELKRFNENVDWLKKSQKVSESGEYVNMKEAMKLLGRQRTWIQMRMYKEVIPGMDVDASLVRNVDWIREGNRVMIKRDSILRLKTGVLMEMGNKYDHI